MKDHERIENGEGLFALGLMVTDIVTNDFSTDDVVSISLEEDEKIKYVGKLEELRIICKNEKFSLIAAKHYSPFDKKNEGKYWTLNKSVLALVLTMNLGKAPSATESLKIGNTFKILGEYFEIPVKEFFLFLYFPENVIIDNEGVGHAEIKDREDFMREVGYETEYDDLGLEQ